MNGVGKYYDNDCTYYHGYFYNGEFKKGRKITETYF